MSFRRGNVGLHFLHTFLCALCLSFLKLQIIITLESVIFPIFLSFAYATLLILTLDQELNLSEHVNLITRSCYYQLRQLRALCAPFPMTLLWSLCMSSSLAELITVAQSLLVSH